MKIVIAGAGIGGLTAALALAQRGFEVVVLEQAQALREIGAGLQLASNATRALFDLGLERPITQIASEPLGKRVRLWNTGQTWPLFDLGAVSRANYGAPYITLHRADLHTILADALAAIAPDALRLGRKVVGCSFEGGGATATTATGETFEADLLVGADGVHSGIRAALFGPDSPKFSGITAWRGIVDVEKLPPHMREPYGCNWVGPGAHVVHYPLRANRLINFVGAIERGGWEVESWSERGLTQDCLADFAGWHEDVLTLIRAIEIPYKWALMVREPMERWSRGHATLLGDACHPTLPFLAQGAAMAIEDGHVLARALAAHPGDVPAALRGYETARLERTAKVVRGSAANALRFHNPALAHAEGAQAYVDGQFSEAQVKERYEWLFRYDVNAVAV